MTISPETRLANPKVYRPARSACEQEVNLRLAASFSQVVEAGKGQ